MIEINLLPDELKKKVLKVSKPVKPGLGLEAKHIILLAPLTFAILLCVHLVIAILSVVEHGSLGSLETRWLGFAQQKKILDEFNERNALLSEDAQTARQLAQERIIWSEKLNKLSLYLPSGIWFNELSINAKDLVLRGSVISLNKDELDLIKQLMDNLKNDPDFIKEFSNIEMGSATKIEIGGYEITDFTLNAILKAK